MPQENIDARQQKNMLDKNIHTEYQFYGQENPLLIKDLTERWLLDIKNIMKPAVYARYSRYAEKYIMPYAGNMCANTFDKTALSAMLALLQAGHSQKEPLPHYKIYSVESMVRAIIQYGAEKHLMPKISLGESEYKTQDEKYAMPLAELEVLQLVHIVEQQELDFQIQIMLPLYTGISLSEFCGLKWKDIDIQKNKIYIHRKIVHIQQKTKSTKTGSTKASGSREKKAIVLAEYKLEASCRDFIMPEKISNLLQAAITMKNPYKESYVAEIDKKDNKADNTSEKISETGTTEIRPPDARELQYRLKTAGEQAGIPDLTYQMLRDTFALMGLNAGGDIYSIACVMGIDVNAACERYKMWLVKDDGFMKRLG